MSKNTSYKNLLELDRLCINSIRFLSVDAIQKANSGHPGLPMGFAPVIYQLFTRHLRFNPRNPKWLNRDRFILSAGHGSALLYSMLHLCGYDISLDDLKSVRQLDSVTPGHPEYGHTPGVEVTTGPLGQGIASAVGMAIAGKYQGAYFNKKDHSLFDYKIYAVAGDGCLQEGVSSEACSLAGHLGLENLIVLYDDNQITIDGGTEISFSEDVKKRFEAYGWFVQEVSGDGHDLEKIDKAIINAKTQTQKPSLIKISSVIGYGSPNKQGTSGVHGSPLGADEIRLTKKSLGWDYEESFFVPPTAREYFQATGEKGVAAEASWDDLLKQYCRRYDKEGAELTLAMKNELPFDLDELTGSLKSEKPIATRSASGKILDCLMPKLPFVFGGSADLTPSNNTFFSGAESFQKNNPLGRYIHYGVREHAMGAIINGISISGITRAYGGTFLCFSDYMLPALRVAALSGYPSVFVFTHDSIGLGEDGPTHQPVEQLSYLRAMPGLTLIRPADFDETLEAWKYILRNKDKPIALALTRQALPVYDRSVYPSAANLKKGAYSLVQKERASLLLIASGSEVSIAMEAHEKLAQSGIISNVVSVPSLELFEEQPQDYRDQVLSPGIKNRIVIEAGIRRGWEGVMGEKGLFFGMKGFGASAPAGDLFEKFGITVSEVLTAAKKLVKG
ncbi:MAG: transketolase [Deltaproteobacteria bacterium]|nr:transketolase [Deltaproteobacteria bacterium]